jgi:hypothetical protein
VRILGREIPGNHNVPWISHDKEGFVPRRLGDRSIGRKVQVQVDGDRAPGQRFLKMGLFQPQLRVRKRAESGVSIEDRIGKYSPEPLAGSFLNTAVVDVLIRRPSDHSETIISIMVTQAAAYLVHRAVYCIL